MKSETKQYLHHFEKITGITPLSAKLGTGSMRRYVTFTLDLTNPAVKNFADNFFLPYPGSCDYLDILNGLQITYIHVHTTRQQLYADVEIEKLK